jgi:hypothetical protein
MLFILVASATFAFLRPWIGPDYPFGSAGLLTDSGSSYEMTAMWKRSLGGNSVLKYIVIQPTWTEKGMGIGGTPHSRKPPHIIDLCPRGLYLDGQRMNASRERCIFIYTCDNEFLSLELSEVEARQLDVPTRNLSEFTRLPFWKERILPVVDRECSRALQELRERHRSQRNAKRNMTIRRG